MKQNNNKNNNYKILRNIAGIILVVLGILGLIVPIVPGFILISIGIILIGGKAFLRYLKRLKDCVKSRF